MASRKKPPIQELLPPEEESDGVKVEAKPVKRVVVSRVETFEAPSDETLKENGEDEEFDYDPEPRKKKKATEKEERDKLRAELTKYGVTPASDLRYSLFKYVDPNSPIAGNQAETESCGRFQITKEGLLNGDHVEKARTFGPGRYFFLVYKSNQLVSSFDARIAQGWTPQPQQQPGMVNTIDPQNPNVTIQMPAGQAQPPIDMRKAMREYMKDMKDTAEMFGFVPAGQAQQQNPQPQMSAKATLLEALASEGDLVSDTIRALKRKSGGDSGEKDLTVMLIEHGPDLIRAAGDVIKGIIFDLKGGNNGQAQNTQAAHPNNGQAHGQQQEHGQAGSIQTVQEADRQALQGGHQGLSEGASPLSPEDELFARVLNACKNKKLPSITATEIVNFASIVEENPAAMVPGYGLVRQFPIGASLWPYVDLFTNTPAEQVLAFVAAGENGKEVAEMEHAQSWCEQLQAELKKIEGEVKEDGN